jgi:hypothetical protein
MAAAAATLLGCGGGDDLAGTGDLNCSDFRYQQDAQAVLNNGSGDPNRLDADRDGVACEHLPRR